MRSRVPITIVLILAACTASPVTPTATAASTETVTPSPAPTATHTPRPTPTPVFMEVQGVSVPTNVYLEVGIPMMIRGEEKSVNYFWYGQYGQDFPSDLELSGIVYTIGDAIAYNLTILPGTEIYVTANSDKHNLQLYPGNMREGINTTNDIIEGVHPGEYFYDEGHHISIEARNEFNANGTEGQPILITSAAAEPTRWDWNSLYFRTGTISYATIEYGRPLEPGSNSEISNSIIRHTGGACIWHEASNSIIEDSQISDCAHEAIGGINGQNVIIRNNVIGPVVGQIMGLWSENAPPEIYGNEFWECEMDFLFWYDPASDVLEQYLKDNISHCQRRYEIQQAD